MQKAKIFLKHSGLSRAQIRKKVAVHVDPTLFISFVEIGTKQPIPGQEPGIVGSEGSIKFAYELTFDNAASSVAIDLINE